MVIQMAKHESTYTMENMSEIYDIDELFEG